MFSVIYKVQQKCFGSIIFTAYFEDLDEAKKFAEDTVANINDDFVLTKKSYQDGSSLHYWLGDFNEVTLDDNSWITNFRTDGIRLMPLDMEFETYDELQKFILYSQKIAQS